MTDLHTGHQTYRLPMVLRLDWPTYHLLTNQLHRPTIWLSNVCHWTGLSITHSPTTWLTYTLAIRLTDYPWSYDLTDQHTTYWPTNYIDLLSDWATCATELVYQLPIVLLHDWPTHWPSDLPITHGPTTWLTNIPPTDQPITHRPTIWLSNMCHWTSLSITHSPTTWLTDTLAIWLTDYPWSYDLTDQHTT